MPEGERLPRLHAHPPEVNLPLLCEYLFHYVEVAHRDTPGDDKEVNALLDSVANHIPDLSIAIRGDPKRNRLAAVL